LGLRSGIVPRTINALMSWRGSIDMEHAPHFVPSLSQSTSQNLRSVPFFTVIDD
jgi:hypothetical protein